MFMDRKTVIRMSVFPKLIYRLNAKPIKIPAGLFFFPSIEIDKMFVKNIWNTEVLKENKKVKGILISDLKFYYKLQ